MRLFDFVVFIHSIHVHETSITTQWSIAGMSIKHQKLDDPTVCTYVHQCMKGMVRSNNNIGLYVWWPDNERWQLFLGIIGQVQYSSCCFLHGNKNILNIVSRKVTKLTSLKITAVLRVKQWTCIICFLKDATKHWTRLLYNSIHFSLL